MRVLRCTAIRESHADCRARRVRNSSLHNVPWPSWAVCARDACVCDCVRLYRSIARGRSQWPGASVAGVRVPVGVARLRTLIIVMRLRILCIGLIAAPGPPLDSGLPPSPRVRRPAQASATGLSYSMACGVLTSTRARYVISSCFHLPFLHFQCRPFGCRPSEQL